MKTLIAVTILLTFITLPAFSQSRLSPEDLDKIKLIIIDVVKKEITDSETRMKDYVNVRFDALQKEIKAVEKQIESVDKRVTQATNISYGLIALIVVAVGIPQIISVWQGRKTQELERQIATLLKRIETLEQQRIVNP